MNTCSESLKILTFPYAKCLTAEDYSTRKMVCLKMHKKLCKNSASGFLGMCYDKRAMNFVENVHFRISLRETLKMPRRDAVWRRRKFANRCAP